MTYGRRPTPRRGGDGPPALVIFLMGVALVFGIYYVWVGVRNFLSSGGLGIVEATQRGEIISTATAAVIRPSRTPAGGFTPTAIPECEDFVVSVPNAIVREEPSQNAAIVTSLFENEPVCVLGRPSPDSEWYTIDQRPETRRLEVAYMHESVIRAVAPTPTPSNTTTPLPTVTITPSPTITETTVPRPTETRDPGITDTPTPTLTPTATPPIQSA